MARRSPVMAGNGFRRRTRAFGYCALIVLALFLVVATVPQSVYGSPLFEDALYFRDDTDGTLEAEVEGSWINDSERDEDYKTWEVVVTFTNVDDEDHWSPEDFQGVFAESVRDPETNELLDELDIELRIEFGTKYVMESGETHTFRYGAVTEGSGRWSEFPAEAEIHALAFGAHQQCTDDELLRSAIVDAIRRTEGGAQAADEMQAEFQEMEDGHGGEFWTCDRFRFTNCVTPQFSERPMRREDPTMYYNVTAASDGWKASREVVHVRRPGTVHWIEDGPLRGFGSFNPRPSNCDDDELKRSSGGRSGMECVNPASRHVIAVYGPEDVRHAEAIQDIPEDAHCPPLRVEISWEPQDPAPNQTVEFQGNVTRDDGAISSWYWDFGDGNTSEEAAPKHVFEEAGNYTVQLSVSDSQGYSDNNSVLVSVGSTEQSNDPGSTDEDPNGTGTDNDRPRPGVPGFEAWALIALAGVYAVLRRRRYR